MRRVAFVHPCFVAMNIKLSKRTIDAAVTPTDRDLFLWDADLSGLGLRSTPKGRRTFVYRYRTADGVQRTMKLGRFPDITADQARDLATVAAGHVASGGDPMGERRAHRKQARVDRGQTVEALGRAYLDDVGASAERRRIFETSIVPAIGSTLMAALTEQDVRALHRAQGKSPVMANRTTELLRAVVKWCGDHDEPVPSRELWKRYSAKKGGRKGWKYPEQPKERFLSLAEIARLGAALTTAEQVGLPAAATLKEGPRPAPKRGRYKVTAVRPLMPANAHVVAAIRFLMLSGWREQEALTLKWSDLDRERAIATLPDTKTGRSVRLLGKAALAILTALPVTGEYVFPGRKDGTPLEGVRRVWEAALQAAELMDLRLHDLRHTFASVAADRAYSEAVIARLLGHRGTSITSRYAHLSDDVTSRAADTISDVIARAMAGTVETNVLQFRAG